MGLRELVAAGIIAFSPVTTLAQDNAKPEQAEEDLDKLIEKAEKLYKRNKDAANSVPSDHKQAIPLYEKIFKLTNKSEHLSRLVECLDTERVGHFNTGQLLWKFSEYNALKRKELLDNYGVKNDEDAKKLAKVYYREAIAYNRRMLELGVQNHEVWRTLGIMHARFGEFDDSIAAYRGFVNLKPTEVEAYKSIIAIYISKGKIGDVQDELENIKGINNEEKIRLLTAGMNAVFYDMRARKTGLRLNLPAKEDKLKAAKLFYLTSKTRWDEEMKKEDYTQCEFVDSMHDCLRAGSFDLLAAENDEEREQAFQRFEKAYSPINDKMKNSFGRLDTYFAFVILKNKSTHIVDAEKVHELLKQRYDKK